MSNVLRFRLDDNRLKLIDGFVPVNTERNYSQICVACAEDSVWATHCALASAGFFATAYHVVTLSASRSADNTYSFNIPFASIGEGVTELFFGMTGSYTENGVTRTVASNIVRVSAARGALIGEPLDMTAFQSLMAALNDGLALKENVSNKVQDVGAVDVAERAVKYPSVAAVYNYLGAHYYDKDTLDGEFDRIDDDITNTVKYVEISGTGSTAADDCIEQNTLYRVYISSNIASHARYSLICVVNNDKKTQYAFTRHGFIMYRSKSGDEAWSEWDYLPNHSLMSKAIRKAVIGGFFGIEADSELDKTYNVHNADVDSYLSKIPYEYATDGFEHSHIDEDFTTLTVNRADRPNILSLSKPSNAVTISFKDTNTSKEWSEAVSGSTHDVKNLIPGHLYYYTFYDAGNGVLQSGKISPSGQIRMIDGGGNTFNIRDLGGWSCDGGTLKYGLIYRGCRLNGSGVSLSNDQILFFRNTLGIRDEIDLRSDSNASGITDTALGIGVDYVRKQLHYYQESVQNDGSKYAYLAKRISQNVKEGRISYIHCSSGADRTGQLSMIIEAVCGVAQSDLDRDYELTSFAYETNNERLYSRRRNTSTNADWKTFIAAFVELDGTDLKDKVIRYLVRNGVTIDEINCLRAYFIDGNPAKLAPPYGKATVTKTLTNITTDEIENAIELYQPFETILRPANSCTIQSVTVTMGGSDVTATYYHNGKISIPSVTGNITITATGSEPYTDYDAYNILDEAFLGDDSVSPQLLVSAAVDAEHNPDGHLMLYYVDSEEVRHNIFDFTPYLGGTDDYSQLTNKPQINGITVEGAKVANSYQNIGDLKLLYYGRTQVFPYQHYELPMRSQSGLHSVYHDNSGYAFGDALVLNLLSYIDNFQRDDSSAVQGQICVQFKFLPCFDKSAPPKPLFRTKIVGSSDDSTAFSDWQELGITVQSAAVNNNGTITFTLSDGSVITTTGASVIGPQGPAGQNYVLTAQDKSDIAALVLAQLPTTQGVQYGN